MIPKIEKIAEALMVPGKGILAADESTGTMIKRLSSINIPDTEENERRFRDMLFNAPQVEEYLSGVILYDATIRRKSDSGVLFPLLLESKGIIPGIKVDKGMQQIPNYPDEEVSHGLDDLRLRLDEYYGLGARFTKWRSALHIGDDAPSDMAVRLNAQVLAHYAAIVQEKHMVPIVEPEILFDEEYTLEKYTLERSAEVLQQTLTALFTSLKDFKVLLPGLILKTSMVLPGKESGIPLNSFDIARETVKVLKKTVPKETGGIVFLSGGQTPVQATENLNAIAQIGDLPWPITFSYSRALEEPALKEWKGLDENVIKAQKALLHRLALNISARGGNYKKEME